jgi:diguanylate cyclase (GGDEF)-like protein/PAS domain S-box-containing protein
MQTRLDIPNAGGEGLVLEQFHRSILDHVADGVYLVDLDRRICFWNRAAELLTGFSLEQVVGTRCADNILIHVDDEGRALCKEECPLSATMADGADREAQVYLHHRDGHRIPVRIWTAALRDGSGRIVGAVETFTDNTARMADLQRIHQLEEVAYLDELTGLPNRRHLHRVCQARLAEASRHAHPFGVILGDVDHFKPFNDRYGHGAGDQALRMVGRTLACNCRAYDTVGRWGGDEFLVIAGYTPHPELYRLAQRLRVLVEESKLIAEGMPRGVTLSIGATPARPGDDLEALLRRADELLYRSKTAGRNTVTFEE